MQTIEDIGLSTSASEEISYEKTTEKVTKKPSQIGINVDLATLLNDIGRLNKNIELISNQNISVDNRLKIIEENLKELVPIKKVIIVETISKEDAKERIKELIDQTDTKFYPDEIAEKLHIDFQLVMEIMDELIKEEKIEVIENGIDD